MTNRESHESYGMLQFMRTQSSKAQPLFGSSIKHRNTITMYLREGAVTRELNRDLYFGDDTIVEVEMSYSQFAEAITSMNMGTGVPVTVRYVEGRGRIAECPFVDKKEQFEGEFKESLDKANEKAEQLISSMKELMDSKKNMTKKDKEELLSMMQSLKGEIDANRTYIYKQFNEQITKTVLEAKGEIETFMQNKINSMAMLTLQKDDMPVIENPVDMES